MSEDRRSDDYPLARRDVVRQITEGQDDLLVIAGLGSTAWDVTAAGDRDLNFPLWGAMGGAVAMGLGLALAQPERRVLVITGDGEALMGMGSLATAAMHPPIFPSWSSTTNAMARPACRLPTPLGQRTWPPSPPLAVFL